MVSDFFFPEACTWVKSGKVLTQSTDTSLSQRLLINWSSRREYSVVTDAWTVAVAMLEGSEMEKTSSLLWES